jgi:long-chain acyl-CoA synthetase
VPTHFVRILKLDPEERTRYDLSSLRARASTPPRPCPVPIKREMIDWWGPVVNEYYAGSERHRHDAGQVRTLARQARHASAFRCMASSTSAARTARSFPPGEDGLIYFENQINLPTYHNDPAKTAEAMHAARAG